MRAKTLKSVVACLIVGMCCSSSFALNMIGSPIAELSEGQLELGGEYSLSEFALDFDYSSGSGGADFTKDEMEMSILSGRLGYGITESIEGFARVGTVNIQNSEGGSKFDGDGIAYGFGAKVTIGEQGKIKWGAQAQVNFIDDVEGDWWNTGEGWTGDACVDFMQILVTVGPNYQMYDNLSIYGGPFWYMLDGEKTYDEVSPTPGWYEKYDIENQSSFGGYIGALVDLPKNLKLNVEYQMTSDDNVFSAGLVWRN